MHKVLQPGEQMVVHNEMNSLRSFVLCGFGGIGKTQIAIQYAYSRLQQYDAIFWVQADGADKIANSFRDIAIELQLIQSADEGDPVVTRDLVMEWLSTPYMASSTSNDDTPQSFQNLAKWLIRSDNADKPELLRDFWPVSGNGSALVTSRDPLTKTYLHSTSGTDLQPFIREDAALFLEKLTATDDCSRADHETSLVLCDRLGGFPLALVHVAAIMRRKDLTLKEMLEEYDIKTINPALYNSTEMPPHYKYAHTLSTVWGVENLGNTAHLLLDFIEFLDLDAVAESIIKTKVDDYPIDELESMQDLYGEARTSLISASLIKRDKEKMQLMVHRVVQEGTRNRMFSKRLQSLFGFVVDMLLRAWYHEPEEKFTHRRVHPLTV